jgi:hypothetical protein
MRTNLEVRFVVPDWGWWRGLAAKEKHINCEKKEP